MKVFTLVGENDSLDIVHLKGKKDFYSVDNNNGSGTIVMDSSTQDIFNYSITSAEYLIFDEPDDVEGKVKFKFNDFAGIWRKVINGVNTTLTDLAQFGNTSDIASTFYSNSTYGIGWGTNDNDWKTFIIDEPFTEMYIQYSGFYNQPSAGLGYLNISNADFSQSVLAFSDSHTNSAQGHSLTVDGNTIFTLATTDVVDREDTLQTSLNCISMKGYTSSYPYTYRYIKNLWVR